MLEARPGAYLFLGTGPGAGLHHPAYDFNDEAAPVGASFFARLVERAQPLALGQRAQRPGHQREADLPGQPDAPAAGDRQWPPDTPPAGGTVRTQTRRTDLPRRSCSMRKGNRTRSTARRTASHAASGRSTQSRRQPRTAASISRQLPDATAMHARPGGGTDDQHAQRAQHEGQRQRPISDIGQGQRGSGSWRLAPEGLALFDQIATVPLSCSNRRVPHARHRTSPPRPRGRWTAPMPCIPGPISARSRTRARW